MSKGLGWKGNVLFAGAAAAALVAGAGEIRGAVEDLNPFDGIENPFDFNNEHSELSEAGIVGEIEAVGRLDLASRDYLAFRHESRDEIFFGLEETGSGVEADGEAHAFVDLSSIDEGGVIIDQEGDVHLDFESPYIGPVRITRAEEYDIDLGLLGTIDRAAGFDVSADSVELLEAVEEDINERAQDDPALLSRAMGCTTQIVESLLRQAGVEGDVIVAFDGEPFEADQRLDCYAGAENVSEVPPVDNSEEPAVVDEV